jgi:small-conductance mechanosensitive channel
VSQKAVLVWKNLKLFPKNSKVRPIWDRCYDFKNIFAVKIILFFLLKLLLVFAKMWEKRHFFRLKLAKIVIMASTPGHRSHWLWLTRIWSERTTEKMERAVKPEDIGENRKSNAGHGKPISGSFQFPNMFLCYVSKFIFRVWSLLACSAGLLEFRGSIHF